MNILVVGGAGYIGSHVVYELCDKGFNTFVLDNLSTGSEENIDKRAHFIEHSFTNKHIIDKILKDIDCVIHLAALKAAGESMENPIKYSQNNIVNTIQLIDSCVKNNVEKFIFSSSAAVYGYPEYLPLDENHTLNPINYYGFTKMIIEKQLEWYNRLTNLKVACLRYFNAAGYDMSGRISVKEKNPANLLPIIMETATAERKLFSVFGNDYDTRDGTCIRDYIHVNDLASSHVKCIESLNKNSVIKLNLSSGNSYSVMEVIKEAEYITNMKINYKIVDRRPGDPDKLYAVSNQAKNILKWEPQFSSLENILSSMWKLYNK